MMKKIRSALLSVYHKDGLDSLAEGLHRHGVQLYATGGTYDFIHAMNLPVTAVEDVTGYPSILGGRVKTLHPGVFGGILAKRGDAVHQAEMERHKLPFIDLVVVDLYPFEATVEGGHAEADIIEKIDIGGISLIRAAAKNFGDVVIIPSVFEYPQLQHFIDHQEAGTTTEQRRKLALQAFAVSSRYDQLIARWFEQGTLAAQGLDAAISAPRQVLRYGENPHQQAFFRGRLEEVFDKLSGKELSYNNLLDVDAATGLMEEFSETCFAIIKHNNACGLATAPTLQEAWEKALAGDPVSAFGGVLVCNRELDGGTAAALHNLFFEVLIAPAYTEEAFTLLAQKKNRILLRSKEWIHPAKLYRSVLNGLLEQDPDRFSDWEAVSRVVTQKSPTAQEKKDLWFANKIVKHSRSNAIVLAKNGQLLAGGAGQTSRVDALQHAIAKARHFGFDLEGAVMASDAFFPFADCVEIAAVAGISAVIQPGGSLRDNESVEAADRLGLSMLITGHRHFKH